MTRFDHKPDDPGCLERTAGAAAPRFWRTLDELAEDPAFRERLGREFPSEVGVITDPVARRSFLKVMGASLGLAGLTACTRQPLETIVPYVRQPEEIVPGRPLFYSSAMTLGGIAAGVLVESHEGRPTKIEGNPEHPGSLGASDVFGQAAILDLYDPDRSRAVTNLGEIRPWAAFLSAIRAALVGQEPLQGSGLRLLTPAIGSPTLIAQVRELLARLPSARWHQWDPAGSAGARSGARLAFGAELDVHYRMEEANVVLALDSDFLASGPGSLRYARAFGGRRRPETGRPIRLYSIETMKTPTGASADHRFAARPGEIGTIVRALASTLGVRSVEPETSLPAEWAERVRVIAADLKAQGSASLVVAGETQPAHVHVLLHAINASLGSTGRTVVYTQPVVDWPDDEMRSIGELTAAMSAGEVDVLVIAGGNPVYTAPADLDFAAAMGKVPLRVHLSPHVDETSELCHWHIPEAHFLETWSDARAFDGTASIVQPLIMPLYGGRSAHELIASMSETPEKPPYELVREHWMPHVQPASDDPSKPTPEFEATWRRWLHDGVVPDTAFSPVKATLQQEAVAAAGAAIRTAESDRKGLEIAFRHDPCVLDGRFANNGWLQELPKPITRLTWDNAVLMAPRTAERLGLRSDPAYDAGEHGQVSSDIVELRYQGRQVRGPVFTVIGHAEDCVTVHLGYGRRRGGQLATGAGFNAYALRTSDAPWNGAGLELTRSGGRHALACTQYHHMMEGRDLVRAVTLDEFTRDPHVVHEGHHEPPRTLTLHPEYPYEGYKWGMAIDINACIGCNACVAGCQAENNIPVVGKEQVLDGREMHWLRLDTYYSGTAETADTYFQPVPCMHCENAPCEVVCPVNATVHSEEGLNEMVYNRCIGTRYCSNNCPYKVRRFNYLLYQDWTTASLRLMRNPDVTVRSRGVMEKCTYCVQRINAARITAERERRRIREGEVVTACQAVCPTEAIVFGDLNDPASQVAKLQASQRSYGLLADLNTRPRTRYLAAVKHLNPEFEG
jgi:molybdopterin-containing oxidoreductase family iron-sulfur binding subunit